MHYGVIGLGPVGAIFAAHLFKAGHEVSILENNIKKAEYLSKNPLKISGQLNLEVQFPQIHTDLKDFVAAGPEVYLVCTKGSYSKDILEQIHGLGPKEDTCFVSCQNGIDVEEQITSIFGSKRSLRAVLNFGCNFRSPSEVAVSFNFEHFLSEKLVENKTDQKVCQDWNEAGLATQLAKNFKEEAFKKAILNTALGSPCAVTHGTMAEVMNDPEMARLVKEIIREAIRIGKALGYNLGPDYLATAVSYLSKGGPHKPSMLVDIENKCRTENELNAGQLFRYAVILDQDVPVIQSIYYLIKNLEKSPVQYSYPNT